MKLKKGFVLREVCGEKVIVGEGVETVNFGKLISLNDTAALLWKKAEELGDFTIEQLADALTEVYEVSREQALSDAEALTGRWQEAEREGMERDSAPVRCQDLRLHEGCRQVSMLVQCTGIHRDGSRDGRQVHHEYRHEYRLHSGQHAVHREAGQGLRRRLDLQEGDHQERNPDPGMHGRQVRRHL